jgi:hypothetical protein
MILPPHKIQACPTTGLHRLLIWTHGYDLHAYVSPYLPVCSFTHIWEQIQIWHTCTQAIFQLCL